MNEQTSVISGDQFFILGLTELLGRKLIDNYFLIVDFDAFNISQQGMQLLLAKKNIVAFVSNDIDFYKSEVFETVTVLDRKSSLKTILTCFLSEGSSSKYHLKFELSERERQVLYMIRCGNSSKKIAEILNLSPKTVYTHRRNLMRKLGCENRIRLQQLCLNNDTFY